MPTPARKGIAILLLVAVLTNRVSIILLLPHIRMIFFF